ncbi:molybdate ABC transporter substrate-binding protein [Psychromonas hadalis]|uniref:molybdate ABC transporter substrate-binding protein n=1 Tax=Psychromonas hadalis TaxID=211669 RepID=UPI0003B4A2B5|nr:molybdate ABC transporter substrate-binding protein [Psychromonas hadalis]
MIRFVIFSLLLTILPAQASLKVAVASNFKVTLSEIVALYALQSDQKILISSGSTGTLYNQITHGAPFDLFLSADSERAKLIEQSKFGINHSRFTYAQGTLAFWQPKAKQQVDKNSLLHFKGRVAIANPKLAPYGLAAKQALQSLKLWRKFSYIKGNNIAQAYQFIDTGNIAAGIVAHSLLLQNNKINYYLLPTESYQPVLQQGVMLSRNKNREALQKFVDFLQSDKIVQLIRRKGYL